MCLATLRRAWYLVACQLDAAEPRTLARVLRVPVSGEPALKPRLEFLAKHVDTTPGQLVVEVSNDEVQRGSKFGLHRHASVALESALHT